MNDKKELLGGLWVNSQKRPSLELQSTEARIAKVFAAVAFMSEKAVGST